jgi:hypothetical protein
MYYWYSISFADGAHFLLVFCTGSSSRIQLVADLHGLGLLDTKAMQRQSRANSHHSGGGSGGSDFGGSSSGGDRTTARAAISAISDSLTGRLGAQEGGNGVAEIEEIDDEIED